MKNSPDSSGMVAVRTYPCRLVHCRGNPLWLPKQSTTIRTDSRTKRNDEAPNHALQKKDKKSKDALNASPHQNQKSKDVAPQRLHTKTKKVKT